MEIELKYKLNEFSEADDIFKDAAILGITDVGSEKKIKMHALYFDTEDRRLSVAGMVFRIREEGEKLIATIKWNGSSKDGMHVREEINIPLNDREYLKKPDINIFSQIENYEELISMIEGKKLVLMMEMSFTRRSVRLDNGSAIFELSIDSGSIECNGSLSELNELEIELFSGSYEELKKIGEYISNKFNLSPENHSKFRQGLDLLGKNRV